MRNSTLLRILTTFFLLIFSVMPLYALDAASGKHRGAVTSLIHNRNTIISATEDGFMEIWSVHEEPPLRERFQLTPHRINSMVKHPLKDEICIVESYGIDNYIISVWNYRKKEKLFSIQMQPEKTVTFVNYSAGGNFIIAADSDGSYITLLDSVTGKIISAPEIPAGTVSLAITGRTERNMLLYMSENEDFEGQILYLDLASGAVTGNFSAPEGFSAPIIFGNNRFLAGINSGGLFIVDAATGAIVNSIRNIQRGALLCSADDGFYCLSGNSLIKFTVDRRGNFSRQELSLSLDDSISIISIAYNEFPVLAASDGDILLPGQQGKIIRMTHNYQTLITEIAAAADSIAFLTKNGELCFLPLDYRLLEENQNLTLALKSGYTRITAAAPLNENQFILWQSENTQYVPRFIFFDKQKIESSLNFIIGRFPLRSISSMNGKILVLDSGGNAAVYNFKDLSASPASSSGQRSGAASTTRISPDFTFSSIGAIDAVLVDNERFFLCRSVIGGSSPFLFVNINTGETVPVSYPAQAGVMAYAGNSGNIYAAAVERDKTTVAGFSAAAASVSGRIFEYPGEASLSIAESAGLPAIACGGEGAAIYGQEIRFFERTNGLPVKLLGCDKFFLSLDSEGNISWHDNRTGKLLAVFRLYENNWTLSSGREIKGELLRP